mmetsp:Transcript_6127/g.9931  ORF Transcript_6127/g.9931 Transcript_6127/m.9931 type:complete len:126 (+) Transcript_6127:65-442(+)|eukprot:CAMPEP_0169263234 /NCGR_PEP_ID=MMETSP1016-20121227/44269_1 /TAXON_ID=342587 /ORGANISM="Karlodinium micrum, Strain CCMP2283" /LENGTH=125 /DNA_ID=CAMNT_0009346087 /DNA_START=19 /DNA_END=396 /DNA_ORIENTATION=+
MGYGGYGKGKWFFFDGYGKGKGKGKLKVAPELKVWVGGLSSETTWKDLQTHMNQAGKTKWVEVFNSKSAVGTGAVVFSTAEEATNAVATLNGSELKGGAIQVDVWVKKEKETTEGEGDGVEQEKL